MIAFLARGLKIGCLVASLLAARVGEGRVLLRLDVPSGYDPADASATNGDAFERASSPLDAWLNPYAEAAFAASWGTYDAMSELHIGMARVPTSIDWWSSELTAGRRFRFADPRRFVLLRRYAQPGRERFRPAASLWATRLDPERFPAVPGLNWRLTEVPLVPGEPGPLSAIAPVATPAMRQKKCPAWARPVPIVVTSWGSDYDRLPLIDCDGSIAVDALDRISALARIIGQARPELPLPDAPASPEDWPDEWVPGIRLLHPRLLWIVQRIGEAFPKRTIHILSGYRRDERDTSPHRMGRALDISVRGLAKEQLFAYCMTLKDVACGYYPYHPFVHVDVRPFGSPKVYWVDASQPGERSQYVDEWPGVVEGGALVWADSE
jgi:hypothetical protein